MCTVETLLERTTVRTIVADVRDGGSLQSVPPVHSQFAWRRRAARRCEARRHEGHDVRGGALARGSPLEEDLVQQPLVDAALLVAAGRGGHQAVDRAGRADRVIGAMHEEEAEVAAPAGQERAALGLEAEQAEALRLLEEQMDLDLSDSESIAPSEAGGDEGEARKKRRELRQQRAAKRRKAFAEVKSKFSKAGT